MQFANGRDAQPIAGGAEVFFIRHDETDLAGVVRVTKDLRRAIAALADLMDPAAAQQFIAQHHAGEMVTAEQVAAFTGFHQLNKAQLDTTGLDPREEGIELVMVNITHQHGIHLHLVKAGGEGGVNAVHHLVELILAGDGMELAGVEAINADVNRRQAGIAPAFDIARQAVTVGSDRNLTDRRVFTHGGNDLGEVAAQGGFPTGEANFFGAQRGESARNPAYFVYAEKAIVIDGAGLVTVRQAVGATEVAHIGNRQTQVIKLTRECIGKL